MQGDQGAELAVGGGRVEIRAATGYSMVYGEPVFVEVSGVARRVGTADVGNPYGPVRYELELHHPVLNGLRAGEEYAVGWASILDANGNWQGHELAWIRDEAGNASQVSGWFDRLLPYIPTVATPESLVGGVNWYADSGESAEDGVTRVGWLKVSGLGAVESLKTLTVDPSKVLVNGASLATELITIALDTLSGGSGNDSLTGGEVRDFLAQGLVSWGLIAPRLPTPEWSPNQPIHIEAGALRFESDSDGDGMVDRSIANATELVLDQEAPYVLNDRDGRSVDYAFEVNPRSEGGAVTAPEISLRWA